MNNSKQNTKKENKMKKTLITTAALVWLSGCTTMTPVTATSNKVVSKKGVSCEKSILLFPLGGEPTVYAAAKAGGISKIATVDSHATGIFPFYYDNCVVVHGQ